MEAGVCRPSASKCGPGTIPDFETGCVPVGVPDCAEDFIDERGFCLPAADACAPGSFPVPSLGCVPIDGEAGCGTGKWGNVVEAVGDVHVDATYALDDSDGSRAKPYATLQAALAAVTDGNRVVIAEGTYEGQFNLTAPITLEGVCPSKVTLTAAAPIVGVLGGMVEAGEVATVKRVSLTSELGGVAAVSGELHLEGVHVHDVNIGITVFPGAAAHVSRTLVSDIRLAEALAYGIVSGGEAEVTETAILRARTGGLGALDGGSLVATDVLVDDTREDTQGFALAAYAYGGSLTIDRSVLVRSPRGLFTQEGGSLTIRDSVVAATTDPVYGDLLEVFDATLTAERNVLADSAYSAIYHFGGELHSKGNRMVSLEGGGIIEGIQPGQQAICTSEKDVIGDTGVAGIWGALGFSVFGSVIEDVRFVDFGLFAVGAGIIVNDGGATIEQTFIAGASDYGIASYIQSGSPTPLTIRSSRIEGMVGVDGRDGVGVVASGDWITVAIEKLAIDDVRGAGIFLRDARGTISDTVVHGVAESAITAPALHASDPAGPVGAGVVVKGGKGVELVRTWLEGYAHHGIVLVGGVHTLDHVRALGGEIGLAIADAAVDISQSNFEGNSESEQSSEVTVALP